MKPIYRVVPANDFMWKLQKKVWFWWDTEGFYFSLNSAINAAKHLMTQPHIIK